MRRNRKTLTKDELFNKMLSYFSMWRPENAFDYGTPAYNDAREVRLDVAKYKRENKKKN